MDDGSRSCGSSKRARRPRYPLWEVARRARYSPSIQLHGWRRQARLGLSTQECRLVPIAVAPAESKVCERPKAAVGDAPPIIELVLRATNITAERTWREV